MNRSEWDTIFSKLTEAVKNDNHELAKSIKENIDILLEKENDIYYESYDSM